MASEYVLYTLRDFAPVVKIGNYVALPRDPTYSKYAYFRVVDVEPIDNMVIPLVPREDPDVTTVGANSIVKIFDPYELRLEDYELLQLIVKIVNFPIKFRIGIGEIRDYVYNKYSRRDMWRDWNTPLNELVYYFTGAKIFMGSERPRYCIWIYNPWSFNIPTTTADVEVPSSIVMVLSGYRFIIERVSEEPEHYTVIPTLPYVQQYVSG